MREIPRAKKLEVAQYYLLGHRYGEIEAETGVSHGSITNIIKEIESGRLTIPGTAFDQVNDLRQVALGLKRKGIEASQASLGIVLFDRLLHLGIAPGLLDKWAELAKRFVSDDFPAKRFVESAIRLHEIEDKTGRPFDSLAEEHSRLQEDTGNLRKQVDLLHERKLALSKEMELLSKQVEALGRAREKEEGEAETTTARIEELKSTMKEREEEGARLNREVRDLPRRKAELSSEVDGKEEALARLVDLGLSEEDLLSLKTFLGSVGQDEASTPEQVKQRFFSALSHFKEISALEKAVESQTKMVEELTERKSLLEGNINELRNAKALLEGEIDSSVSSVSQKLHDIGQAATQQIQEQVTDIRTQLDDLLRDALKAGEAVGRMHQMTRSGQESEKSLETGDGLMQTLVVVPGQFRCDSGSAPTVTGTQRLYSSLSFDLLRSNSSDWQPPQVSGIDLRALDDTSVAVTVNASDPSGIASIVVLQIGEGTMTSISSGPLLGPGPYTVPVSNFVSGNALVVQVVDGAGNVATATGKGANLSVIKVDAGRDQIFVPGIPSAFRATVHDFSSLMAPVSFIWSFGDGATLTGRLAPESQRTVPVEVDPATGDATFTVEHTYSDAATTKFSATLKVTDAAGGIGVDDVMRERCLDAAGDAVSTNGDLTACSLNNDATTMTITLSAAGQITDEFQYRVRLDTGTTTFHLRYYRGKWTGLLSLSASVSGNQVTFVFALGDIGMSSGDLVRFFAETQAGVAATAEVGIADKMPDSGMFGYILR